MHALLLAIATLTTLGAACGGTTHTDAPPACVAGITQACLCVGGGSGVQSCKDDGSGFLPCECGGGDGGTHDTSPPDAVSDSAIDSLTSDTTDSAIAETASDSSTEAGDDSGTGSTYSEKFIGGETSTTQCTDWDAWRATLSAKKVYTKITVKGSLDPTGRTCADIGVSGPKANTLCQALRTGTADTEACGPDAWIVSLNCGGPGVVGLIVDNPPCGCGTGYAVRPCIGSSDWGGIGGTTCGAPTQTMTVICE